MGHTIFNLAEVLEHNPKVKYILVQGDTTTALSGALVALNTKRKLIHLEAGLRTYDNENPYPEEQNRVLISKLTDIHLCPTQKNFDNLIKEDVEGKKYVVGNTILDTLLPYKGQEEYNNTILVTLHRRENHDKIDLWFREINRLAKIYDDYEFVLPLHPNPNVQKHKGILTYVKVIDPLSHESFIRKLVKCRMVISDSGGIQEECSFFKKKVIVCRKVTERPESLGTTSFLCPDPEKLVSLFTLNNYKFDVAEFDCPYGDGASSQKVVDILQQEIYI